MKRVLTAVVLIPLILVLVFLPAQPHWQALFTGFAALVAALAAWEFLGLSATIGAHPPRIAVVAAIVVLFAAYFEWPDQLAPTLGLLSLGLLVYCSFSSPVERVLA